MLAGNLKSLFTLDLIDPKATKTPFLYLLVIVRLHFSALLLNLSFKVVQLVTDEVYLCC